MMLIDDLVPIALLGTRNGVGRLPTLPDAIADVIETVGVDESKLLDIAAAATLYERAGYLSRKEDPLADSAAADKWPECSRQASILLERALENPNGPLLVEWLDLAVRANKRAAHRLLPRLLEVAAGRNELRDATSAVIDERGRWLTQFNKRWQFTKPSNESLDETWQTGNKQQRLVALKTVRAENPDKALELIRSTWKADSADERAEWIGCLSIGLNEDDEDALEACLDDRSTRVREVAADLLARLPESKFVKRMIERMTRFVSFTPATSGNLLKLKRGTKASFEIILPEAFDKEMQRDGIVEKTNESIGPKQWWFLQVMSYTPLRYWTERFEMTPAEIVAVLPRDFTSVLVRGWLAAFKRGPVVEWLEPVISVGGVIVRVDTETLKAIPPARRAEVLSDVLNGSGRREIALHHYFDAWKPLDEMVSKLLIGDFEPEKLLLNEAHHYLHPTTLTLFEEILTHWSERFPDQRRKIDQAITAISLRRELHKEFAR